MGRRVMPRVLREAKRDEQASKEHCVRERFGDRLEPGAIGVHGREGTPQPFVGAVVQFRRDGLK